MQSAVAPITSERLSGPAVESETRCAECGEHFPSTYRICPIDGSPLGREDAPDDPLVLSVLAGTYRIVDVLAQGGMATVYEAEHLRLDRRFAVKVIHETYASNADAISRFDREARAAARIRSDHVLDVVDVLRAMDGRPCMVTELLDGEDLHRRLTREEKLPLREALSIARKVCRGLAAAHAHGIVHRDLKPSNVFLSTSVERGPSVRILDFGVARVAGTPDITRDGAVVGTPSYMPPEQARAGVVDERSDLYAVGALLYHMLTGRPPYLPGEPGATLLRVLRDDPPPPRTVEPSIPVAVEATIQRAMARDPGQRHRSAVELERELESLDAELSRERAAIREDAIEEEPPEITQVVSLRTSTLADVVRRARWARPRALGALAGLTLAAAAVAGIAVRSLLSWMVGEASWLVTTLVVLAALSAGGWVGIFAYDALRSTWSSLPRVDEVGRRSARSLAIGAAAFGGCELGRILLSPADSPAPVLSLLVGAAGAAFIALRGR